MRQPYAKSGHDGSGYWLEIGLPGTPKTPNELLGGHRMVKSRNAVNWKQLVYLVARGHEPQKPLKSAVIHITRHAPRSLDYDGLVGSMKPVVDGLLTRRDKVLGLKKNERKILWSGILENDTWAITGPWIVDQKITPIGQEWIQIVIRERALTSPDRTP